MENTVAEKDLIDQVAFTYLIIDGTYFKVRGRRVGTEAVLCAVGIREDGHKEHLGFDICHFLRFQWCCV